MVIEVFTNRWPTCKIKWNTALQFRTFSSLLYEEKKEWKPTFFAVHPQNILYCRLSTAQ